MSHSYIMCHIIILESKFYDIAIFCIIISFHSQVSIQVTCDKGGSNTKCFNLSEIKDDLESQYQIKMKDVFPFTLEQKLSGIKEVQKVQGCLMYFPNESGEETLPETTR